MKKKNNLIRWWFTINTFDSSNAISFVMHFCLRCFFFWALVGFLFFLFLCILENRFKFWTEFFKNQSKSILVNASYKYWNACQTKWNGHKDKCKHQKNLLDSFIIESIQWGIGEKRWKYFKGQYKKWNGDKTEKFIFKGKPKNTKKYAYTRAWRR